MCILALYHYIYYLCFLHLFLQFVDYAPSVDLTDAVCDDDAVNNTPHKPRFVNFPNYGESKEDHNVNDHDDAIYDEAVEGLLCFKCCEC